jgi:hypothetical protein
MKILDLKLKRGNLLKDVRFTVERMVNAGYASRSQEKVWKHIEELKEKGVPAPDEIPTLYPVASYLITTGNTIEVVEEDNSGEVEYVLLIDKDDVYVGVGSDHTDRKLEAISIVKAKQMCPNVISSVVWLYDDLKDHWDQLVLRSWVLRQGERILYQEGDLGELLSPSDLISFVRKKMKGGDGKNLRNVVIYSGTIPIKTDRILAGEGFEAQLYDPVTKETLECKYSIELLDFIS